MTEIFVALEMPIELGAVVISSSAVQASLRDCPAATMSSEAVSDDVGGAYQDIGATTLLILGTPTAITAVKGLFSVIRIAIIEAHKTQRERQSQEHELRKLVLVLGAERENIDLAAGLQEIEARVDALENQAVNRLSR